MKLNWSKSLIRFCGIDLANETLIVVLDSRENQYIHYELFNPSLLYNFLQQVRRGQYKKYGIIKVKRDRKRTIYQYNFKLKIIGVEDFESSGNNHKHFFDCSIPLQSKNDFSCEFRKSVSFSAKSNIWIRFYNCIFFKGLIFTSGLIQRILDFRNCVFLSNMDFSGLVLSQSILFTETRLMGQVNFKGCRFEHEVIFDKCKFESDANFSFTYFYKNSFFKESTFQQSANFFASTFKEYVCFYGTKFHKPPSLIGAIFKSDLNLVNSKLACDFDQIKEFLQKEIDECQDGTLEFSSLANDYRDSFRLMKNALLKSNNALDASTYHRAELYCKEIELKHKDKNSKTFRDRVDQYVLKFYRHTSDHHTDLPKILSWIIVAIGMFGTLLFTIRYGVDLQGFLEAHNHDRFFSYLVQLKQIEDWQTCLMGVFYILMFGGLLIWILKRLLLKFKSIPILILRVFSKTFQILLPARTFIQIKTKLCRFLQSCCRIYNILRLCISLFVVIAMIYTQPKYILGIGSFFGANRSGWENLLIVTYSIIMFLLLFSLQKTARKNSIVVT